MIEADPERAALQMLTAMTISVAGVANPNRENNGAGIAIMHRVMDGDPIPPDYWPEVARCTDRLRELIKVLEGNA